MRVLLVSDFYPPVRGGLEFHVDALATELVRRGDDVAVATLTHDATPSSAAVRVVPITSIAHALPHHDRDRPFHPPVPDPVARRGLRRAVRDFVPDVIHGHSWLTVSLPRTSTPVVFTAHDYALICQLRTLMQPDVDICSGPDLHKCIACGTASYGRARSQLLARGVARGRRHVPIDQLVAVSSAVLDALRPHLDVPARVIPNFVAPGVPTEPLPDALPERFVLFAGDGRSYKGVPELLDVWASDPPPALPLVLASQRPPTDPLPAGVVSVSLSRGQMAAAWQRAELAVAPSRWADPCPTVVLEAMQAGVPVVGTAVGGIAEMVRDGVDGVLVPPRDARNLGVAITSLLEDGARRRRLGVQAGVRAADYTVEVVTDRIRGLYKEVIGQ